MTALASTANARSDTDAARSKRIVLLAAILGSGAVFLDGTLVNVALPAIRADLHGGLSAQQWILDAYLLTLGALLLVGGSLGDLLGRRLVFELGVSAFRIVLAAVRRRANGGLAMRGARTAGGSGRPARAGHPRADHGDVRAGRAWCGDRIMDRMERYRDRRWPADRRLARAGGVVAVDLRDQPAARPPHSLG